MNRAFIFTIDSVLALMVAAFIAIYALSFSSQFLSPTDNTHALTGAGRDMLAALERNGTLEQAALYGNTEGIVAALDSLPSSYCGTVELVENGTIVNQAGRTGCSCGTEVATAFRTFLADGEGTQREMHARFGGCVK